MSKLGVEYFLLFALILLRFGCKSFRSNLSHSAVRHHVTDILNTLLTGYDKGLRPQFFGDPVTIFADINIRSMGPISEQDMSWLDDRLKFNDTLGLESLALSPKMLEKIWKPDTYFSNGRKSLLHTLTVPNNFVRLSPNGRILYSMRLTIRAACPMFLRYFPIDEQICPLGLGSFAYSTKDIIYSWKNKNTSPVEISPDVTLSQFELTSHPCSNETVMKLGGVGYSQLSVKFHFQRRMGYFVINVYVPCTLVVILSWVSFWIQREATADRVSLGITSVLTLTTLSMESRDDLPRVAYPTALDWFVFVCFGYVISSLVEFAAVHHFTKFGIAEPRIHLDDSDSDSDFHEKKRPRLDLNKDDKPTKTSWITQLLGCIKGKSSYLQFAHRTRSLYRKRRQIGRMNSVSNIDRVARIFFPLTFGLINIFYWISYTKTSQADYRFHHKH